MFINFAEALSNGRMIQNKIYLNFYITPLLIRAGYCHYFLHALQTIQRIDYNLSIYRAVFDIYS